MEANFHLFLVLSFVRAVASCLEGTLEPDQILSEPFHEVQGNCSEGSFQTKRSTNSEYYKLFFAGNLDFPLN